MTLNDLATHRRIGLRPADPIHITDVSEVHLWCLQNNIPCLWMPDLTEEQDYSPLHCLDVVVVGAYGVPVMPSLDLAEPLSVVRIGYYGWRQIVEQL